MRVVHIITGLNQGGAEGSLCRLVTNDQKNTHHVISLLDRGVYGAHLGDKGVQVYTLDMSRGRLTLSALYKLVRLIRVINPDVVQTWMYHADLLGGIAARLAGIKAVVWGIRASYNKDKSGLGTKITVHACAYLSSWIPFRILSNSHYAKNVHIQLGYLEKKINVIHNGFLFDKVHSNGSEKEQIISQLKLSSNTVLLGMVARYDPYKDHENLFKALFLLSTSTNTFCCLLIGPGMDYSNLSLMRLIDKHQIQDKVKLLGVRDDIPKLMAAMDVHVLSSIGESFPNVLAEAMICGTPCVTTDVGDAAVIVDDTGWVVPPSNAQALANGILDAMDKLKDPVQWEIRRQACVDHIISNFSLDRMIESYHVIWKCAVDDKYMPTDIKKREVI